MDSIDLNINNYDYNELCNMFKIERSDEKNYIKYKIQEILNNIQIKYPNEIYTFYYKSNLIILSILSLLENNIIKNTNEIDKYVKQIKEIHYLEKYTEVDLVNNIINMNDLRNSKVKEDELNAPLYNLSRINPNLNNKNNTNDVYNTFSNEVTPGDLNSIKRITQLLNLNLNSCFRHNYFQSNPCDFLYLIPTEIKNVLSMRLVSIEIPNAWYLFSSLKKNNSFEIIISQNQSFENLNNNNKSCKYEIQIPDGNYDIDSLQHYLNTTYFYESGLDTYLKYIKFSINPTNLKSCFEIIEDCEEKISFSLHFSQSISQNIMNTFGWLLGFRIGKYLNITDTILSEGLFDGGGDRYIYVCVNDYQYNNNIQNIVCFDKSILNEDVIAKIPMINGKLSLIINDNNNALSKIRRYNGPVNLSKLQFKIIDRFGTVIDLNNMDFSFTLELEILYESFNFKNVTS